MSVCKRCQLPTAEVDLTEGRCGPCVLAQCVSGFYSTEKVDVPPVEVVIRPATVVNFGVTLDDGETMPGFDASDARREFEATYTKWFQEQLKAQSESIRAEYQAIVDAGRPREEFASVDAGAALLGDELSPVPGFSPPRAVFMGGTPVPQVDESQLLLGKEVRILAGVNGVEIGRGSLRWKGGQLVVDVMMRAEGWNVLEHCADGRHVISFMKTGPEDGSSDPDMDAVRKVAEAPNSYRTSVGMPGETFACGACGKVQPKDKYSGGVWVGGVHVDVCTDHDAMYAATDPAIRAAVNAACAKLDALLRQPAAAGSCEPEATS